MGKVLAKIPAGAQHPLAAELRRILNNPNASLGELATVVNRINAELKLFEEQSKRQLKEAGKGKPASTAAKAELESLNGLVAGIKVQGRAPRSR